MTQLLVSTTLVGRDTEVSALEDQPGNRWVVMGGDRIRVDMVGRRCIASF